MKLVIVESPAKAKTINKYLGKDYQVLASFGHIRDLPSKDGSVLPDEDFAMTWELSPGGKKRLQDIIKAVKEADTIVLASDPDREGEAIAWHILEELKAKKLLKERINKECHSDHFDIVCIPCLLYEGFKEVLINDLCYNILILIEEEKTFECLFNELLPCFSSEISKDKEQTYKLILTEVEYLLYHGVICIN